MRKYFFISLLFLAFSSYGAPEQDGMLDGIENPTQSRAAIEELRLLKTEEFDQLERDCYNKFAVNDCIYKVNSKRRQVIGDLKRQEVAISKAERMQNATEQLQRLEQKKKEFDERNEEASAIDPVAAVNEKTQKQQDKIEENIQKSKQEATPPKQPKVAVVPDQGEVKQLEATHQQKLEDAIRRRIERDKRLKESDPTVKGLTKPAVR